MAFQNNFQDFYSRFDGQKSKQSSLVILSEKKILESQRIFLMLTTWECLLQENSTALSISMISLQV